jgi:hypothetical protein
MSIGAKGRYVRRLLSWSPELVSRTDRQTDRLI